MQVKIEDIALSVKYGPHIKTMEKGEVKYLKANHFDEDYRLSDFSNSYTKTEAKLAKFLLNEQDVLLAAKGFRFFAWAYDRSFGDCIASSVFYVIKVDTNLVLARYLALYLNLPRVQHTLKNIGLGVSTPSIPKKELQRLTIDLPSLKEQQRIINVIEVIDQQIEIENQILVEKKKLKTGLINYLISKRVGQ